MRGNIYQTSLIGLGITATVLYGAFFYREIFPEYKLYQKDFAALEEFRSSYTGEPPAPFDFGVKQIVLEDERNGPPIIDRCITCHVALEIDSYSPTKIAYDINGNIQLNADGFPLQIDNENYVWKKLDDKIADLKDEKVNAQLKEEGKNSEVSKRLAQAEEYEALKTVKVGEHIYDTRKVLAMHPLIGRETRPFLYHPTEEYGCTSCHSGNGNGLTTEKAHGPVFDHQYETAFEGYVPQFTESDPQNDPAFANAYNHKPGDALLFQTTPILVGALIQAKCAQCHKTSDALLEGLYGIANNAATQSRNRINAVTADYDNQIQAFLTMVEVKQLLSKKGYDETIATLIKEEQDFSLPAQKLKLIGAEKDYLLNIKKEGLDVSSTLNHQIEKMVGDTALTAEIEKQVSGKQQDKEQIVKKFIDQNRSHAHATGSLFTKLGAANLEKAMVEHVVDTEGSLGQAVNDPQSMAAMQSDIDYLTKTLKNGQNLFISQACYACHRISGYSRGGVGPDLTEEGKKYPWFVKQSIVWPNADTNVRNMPTMHLDHVELESLLTYVLAQTGHKPSESRTNYSIAIHEWEAGKQMPWEKPVPPDKIKDVNYAMEVFATEGCASCHRLEGFDSNVGFAVEKDKTKSEFDTVYKEKQWFQSLFPEESPGSQLVAAIENHTADIDKRIAGNVRQSSILEELEKKHPGVIESYYSNFRFASRAKNHEYEELLAKEKDPRKKEQLSTELDAWKERVHRILMVYIQEYGLGRLVGPRPNWSGVYRTDQWLMEHFRNPSAHSPNSIMPAFPFDDSKFMSLTHMLDVLGIRNRNAVHAIWDHHGFNPEQAYEIHCAQCHGTYKQGNGPVAEWIYPIPKNLTNSDFLKNLTRERAIQSITHGIIGTPMPPWGEAAGDKSTADGIPVLSKEEIHRMVDWLYSSFPGNENPQSLKWDYKIDDVMDELKREGTQLDAKSGLSRLLFKGNHYFAAMNPVISKKNPENDSEILK